MSRAEAIAAPKTLVIACGALAREYLAVVERSGWKNLEITCLPASWHNRPEKIPEGVRRKIRAARGRYDRVLVLYGDCGTGGILDQVLSEEGVERIAGPHCYEFFSGAKAFEEMMEAELGSFFLTDYMVRHFDRLIIQGLGLDRRPDLRDAYFGNYRKLVYLSQVEDGRLLAKAQMAAQRLGLAFEHRHTGFGGLETFLTAHQSEEHATHG
ncbi:MAG TPA: DUF1638 domain-containing protein [Alphaproteobacteria bacterium]|nr:DUF1638 domain-containing protein [Alphaproteobacteria bacterium]